MDGVFSPIKKQLAKAILDHIHDMTKRIKDKGIGQVGICLI